MAVMLLHVTWGLAQTATVIGRVIDAQTTGVVDYADVVITDMNDKIVAMGMVDNGNFRVEKVPVGDVIVMVRIIGYEPYVSDKLTLQSGQTFNLGTIRLLPA